MHGEINLRRDRSSFDTWRSCVVRLGMWLALGFALCAGAGELEFVIIGDTRPRFESENFRDFEELIPRINALHPAFVINLGDLIYGYGPRSKEKQWDKYQQVVKGIQAPYYQVPGNHDTHSKEARRIYGRRFGKFYESFDYENYHLVLLDSNEGQRWGHIGTAEFNWLKEDLRHAVSQTILVFTHFPIWEPDRLAPENYEFWSQQLHPLLRQYRVRAVFAGHFHAYGPTREFDGIRYFITGGGGAELLPDYRKSGGEHHFLRVKLSGDQLDLRVVTGRGEMTDAEADVMGGYLFADRHSSRVGINVDAQNLAEGVKFSFSMQNPYAEALTGQAEWVLDASAFAVQPSNIPVHVAPHALFKHEFTLKTFKDAAFLQSFPRLEFNVIAGGRRHRFHRDLLLLQPLKVPFRRGSPTLDGHLSEWHEVPVVSLGRAKSPDARIQMLHDPDYLYLVVNVPGLDAEAKEESAFPDDLQIGLARRLNQTDLGGDFLRLGFEADASTARSRTPGSRSGTIVPGVRSAARSDGGRTTFEMAIPLRFMKRPRLNSSEHLILNLSYPLPDHEVEAHDTPVPIENTFSYQVRYGSDSLVPVHFIELELAPGK